MDAEHIEKIKQYADQIKNEAFLLGNKQEEKTNKIWTVYYLDESWLIDRDTIKLFYKWEDAYKYYRELAEITVKNYKTHNERLKRPNVITDFTEHTYFLDNNYPEFWIDNKKNGNCHLFFEYEECILRETFIQ